MIKLNPITSIDTKYRKTIMLWFDLYQEKYNKDNRIIKAVAIP
jgi:hypothetical protein